MSDGSPHARFRRAVATGNPMLVRAAAAELPWVSLPDALSVCLVFAEADEEGFSRAAAKFVARYSFELPGVNVEELQALAAALQAAREPEMAHVGLGVLSALASSRHHRELARAIEDAAARSRRRPV